MRVFPENRQISRPVVAAAVQPALAVRAEWTLTASGHLGVRLRARRTEGFPVLPRFGLRLFLPESLDRVVYRGLGPGESYVDKRRSCRHGEFRTTVAALHEGYLRPQENGSRADCDSLVLSGDGAPGLSVVGLRPFSFNASAYTQEELTARAHDVELTACGNTVHRLPVLHHHALQRHDEPERRRAGHRPQ